MNTTSHTPSADATMTAIGIADYHAREARLSAQRFAAMDETFTAPIMQEMLRLALMHDHRVIQPPFPFIINPGAIQ